MSLSKFHLSSFLLFNICMITPSYSLQPYLNAQIGTFGVNNKERSYYNTNVSESSPGFAGRIGFGLSQNITEKFGLGLELAANYYQIKYSIEAYSFDPEDLPDCHIKRVVFDLLALSYYNITSKASIYIKFGGGYAHRLTSWDKEHVENYRRYIDFYSSQQSSFIPKIVFGFGYDITRKINLNISLNQEFKTTYIASQSYLGFGINYLFC